VHALVDELLRLLEELTCHHDDASGAITDFVVLAFGNVDEGLGSGVHDVKETNQSGAII
jgi:hypothetical protein